MNFSRGFGGGKDEVGLTALGKEKLRNHVQGTIINAQEQLQKKAVTGCEVCSESEHVQPSQGELLHSTDGDDVLYSVVARANKSGEHAKLVSE